MFPRFSFTWERAKRSGARPLFGAYWAPFIFCISPNSSCFVLLSFFSVTCSCTLSQIFPDASQMLYKFSFTWERAKRSGARACWAPFLICVSPNSSCLVLLSVILVCDLLLHALPNFPRCITNSLQVLNPVGASEAKRSEAVFRGSLFFVLCLFSLSRSLSLSSCSSCSVLLFC